MTTGRGCRSTDSRPVRPPGPLFGPLSARASLMEPYYIPAYDVDRPTLISFLSFIILTLTLL